MYIRNRGDGRELSASSKVCPRHLPPSHPWSLLRGWWDTVAMAHTGNYSWCDPKGQEFLPKDCLVQKLSTAAGHRQRGKVGDAPLREERGLGLLIPQSR